MKRLVSQLLPYLSAIHSLLFLFLSFQPYYGDHLGFQEYLVIFSSTMVPSPLYFLTTINAHFPVIPFLDTMLFTIPSLGIYVTIFFLFNLFLFGLVGSLLFWGLLKKSMKVWWVLFASVITHPFISNSFIFGFVNPNLHMIIYETVVATICLLILLWVRSEYH